MNRRKYSFQLFVSYIQMTISIIIPILLTPYMTEKLGSEMYGLWVLLSSIMVYFALSGLGFSTTLLKEISKNPDQETTNRYINTVLGFSLFMIIISSLVFVLILMNLDTLFIMSDTIIVSAKITFSIIYAIFVTGFMLSVFSTLLFAKGLLHIQSYIGIVQSIIAALLMGIVLYFGYSIVEIALVNLLVIMLSSLTTYMIVRKKVAFQIDKKYFDLKLLREMLTPSLHYLFISVGALIVLYSDNIVISSFLGLSYVAVYAIGYKLVDVSQKLLFKVVDIMIPDVAKMYGNHEYEKVLRLHNKMLLVSTTLGLFGYGILFFWGVDIIELWVGKEFTISTDIFRVFVLFGLWHTWVHVSAIFIVAMGIHKETSYMGMLDAILNVVLSIVLLQYYGLLGVALGTLIAHLLTNGWFTNYWFYKKIYSSIKQKAIKRSPRGVVT